MAADDSLAAHVDATDYEGWLFDLDGTLVDAEWGYTRGVFDRVGDRIGYGFSDREAEVLWHGLRGRRNDCLHEWGVDPEDFWPVFHDEEDPQARAEATYLYDDVAFVADIDGPVGLVTHCADFLTGPVLDHLDIRDWFDVVVCCSDETGWKPDPAPVEGALARMGVTDGVLAGDGAGDVGAAWNAGLDSIHVERHDPERRGRCVLADYRIQSFEDLWSRDALSRLRDDF